ncbi:MAG: sigma-54-dependent Fis family transcriptional regulator [Bacteroidales bacterium]|nr:sigma-54-dependent Fis family transcriptional regulator [Bacteroidales bacterium]
MDSGVLQGIKNRYGIVGNDAALNHAIEVAVSVAPTDLSVLISGESGVGKEIIPRIIHDNSRRKNGKYLAVNCAAIPSGTISAELFGHEKGSFTGAVSERKGYFEEADGGTIFLDELADLPKDTQAMLLRVLQNGEFIKVGSSKVQKTDVRVIAATNKDLYTAMLRGEFREDLYYRLNATQIVLPALRDRKDDIYTLFRWFSGKFAEKSNFCKVTLDHDAILLLRSYRWPGNVRQLKNVAESITALRSRPATVEVDSIQLSGRDIAPYVPDEKDTLLPAVSEKKSGGMSDDDRQMFVKAILDLKQDLDALKARVDGGATAIPQGVPSPEEEPEEQLQQEPAAPAQDLNIKRSKREMIDAAILKHGGNVKEAAEELGISERTVYRHMAKKKKA